MWRGRTRERGIRGTLWRRRHRVQGQHSIRTTISVALSCSSDGTVRRSFKCALTSNSIINSKQDQTFHVYASFGSSYLGFLAIKKTFRRLPVVPVDKFLEKNKNNTKRRRRPSERQQPAFSSHSYRSSSVNPIVRDPSYPKPPPAWWYLARDYPSHIGVENKVLSKLLTTRALAGTTKVGCRTSIDRPAPAPMSCAPH